MITKRNSNPKRPPAKYSLSEAEKLILDKLEASIHRAYKRAERRICNQFVHALKTFDAQKIIDIANGVMFFKGKFVNGFQDSDPKRASLLFLKFRLIQDGRRFTVRQVAEYLAGGKPVETPDDGFSSLRRLCNDLGMPIVSDKANKAKKSRSQS